MESLRFSTVPRISHNPSITPPNNVLQVLTSLLFDEFVLLTLLSSVSLIMATQTIQANSVSGDISTRSDRVSHQFATGRKQNKSCDQCRKGKRACNGASGVGLEVPLQGISACVNLLDHASDL